MSFNVTSVCQQLAIPLYNNCQTFMDEAKSVALPFQIITYGIPAVLVMWKVVYCVSNLANFSGSDEDQLLRDPTVEPLLGSRPKERKISRLATIDNAMMTGAVAALSLTPAIAITVAGSYLNSSTCSQLVQSGRSFCEYTLNTIISAI